MRRVLCVRFPNWPLQRQRAARPELEQRPTVLYARVGRGGFRVVAASEEAASAGIVAGLPLADAKALWSGTPEPCYIPHAPEADRAALVELAGWCQRFTPYAGVEESDSPDSLLLDVDGVAHLWGDEPGLAAQVIRELRAEGYRARVAIADAIGAAWALTHVPIATGKPVIVPPGGQRQALGDLPVETLRLPGETIERLHALGLRRVRQLLGLPRESLPSRFGDVLTRRLDQALGLAAESFVPQRPADPVEATWEFEHPVADTRVLERVCDELLGRIAVRLMQRREGVLRLWCGLDLVREGGGSPFPSSVPREAAQKPGLRKASSPGPPSSCRASGRKTLEPVNVAVELVEPHACHRHLRELLTLRLERVRIATEIARVRLIVTQTAPLRERQRELFEADPERERQRHLWRLVDRLSSRLGPQAVLRPRLAEDHQPEHAARLTPVVQERPAKKSMRTKRRRPAVLPQPALPCALSRPLRLVRPTVAEVLSVYPDGPPQRLVWQGRSHRIARHWGPERIETGWWRAKDVRRDYFRVETADGRRFWLYRELREGTWHLHGIFD